MRLMQDLKSLLLANDMQFILSKNKQNTKETLQVPSGADASARATVMEIVKLDGVHLSGVPGNCYPTRHIR